MANLQMLPTWILHSMSRQIDTIHGEMDQWYKKRHDELEDHARQIDRVMDWTKRLGLKSGLEQIRTLELQQDFLGKAFELQTLISSAREVWEFYRDRFELYYSPLEHYRKWTEGAEWVAADCYQTAVRNAEKAGLAIDVERWESPLLQLATEKARMLSTPVTRVRGQRIAQGSQSLPTAIIVLPVDLMANVWGFLALHHEVGHDVDADLGAIVNPKKGTVTELLASGVADTLTRKGVPSTRTGTWVTYISEMFADFFAILSAGPAFVGHMIDALALPRDRVFEPVRALSSTYPPHYLRVHILIRFLEGMHETYEQIANKYASLWDSLCVPGKDPDVTFDEYLSPLGIKGDSIDGYFSDIAHFIEAVVDTPFYRGADGNEVTLRALGAYTHNDHRRVMEVVEYDLVRPGSTGIKEEIKPRLVPSAARFAFEQLTGAGSPTDLTETLGNLNEYTLKAIEKNKPSTVLAGEADEKREKRLEERAQRFRQQVLGNLREEY